MINAHWNDRWDEYLNGMLPPAEQESADQHLRTCEPCRRDLASHRQLLTSLKSLPLSIDPPKEVWSGIATRLNPHDPKVIPFPSPTKAAPRTADGHSPLRTRAVLRRMVPIAAALTVAVGSFWISTRNTGPAWQVSRLQGNPTIGSEAFASNARLAQGAWLETDERSRAGVTIADIGHAEVGPNSRLRMLTSQPSEHRMELARGSMNARVWSPPRIFIVETPSATAIDLGCAYDLTVDRQGAGVLEVTSGEVSLEHRGRESYVPAGHRCETRPGIGPGTPYAVTAGDAFRDAVLSFDFENGGSSSLDTILSLAGKDDALTLWHLVIRVDDRDRERVVDRLAQFVQVPRDVTREGILQLDRHMLDLWLEEFEPRMFPFNM